MKLESFSARQVAADILAKFVFVTYSIFLFGFFLFPEAPLHYKFYNYLVLIPALLVLKQYTRLVLDDSLVLLIAGFCIYMAVSGLWSVPFAMSDYVDALLAVLSVAVFFVLGLGFATSDPVNFEKMLQLLCLVAAGAALTSLFTFYDSHPFPLSRVEGSGRMQSINRGAAVYGFLAVAAAGYYFRSRRWKRFLFGCAVMILMSFVMLSQTRTAIIASLAGLTLLTVLELKKQSVYAIPVFVLAAVVVGMVFPEFARGIGRGMPYRPLIWEVVIEQIRQAPFFGSGMLADTSVTISKPQALTFNHVHNAYLATLRDGGVVGIVMLLWILILGFGRALDHFKRVDDARLIAFIVYASLVIIPLQDRLLTRPREHWLYFWLPIVLILVYWGSCRNVRASTGASPGGEVVAGQE